MSSVWTFCSRSPEDILLGNRRWRRKMAAGFSGCPLSQSGRYVIINPKEEIVRTFESYCWWNLTYDHSQSCFSGTFIVPFWLFSSFTFCSLESEKRVDANMLKMLNKLLDIARVWLKYLFVFFLLMLFYSTETYWHITETKNTDLYNYIIQQRIKLAAWNNWGPGLMSSCWGLL